MPTHLNTISVQYHTTIQLLHTQHVCQVYICHSINSSSPEVPNTELMHFMTSHHTILDLVGYCNAGNVALDTAASTQLLLIVPCLEYHSPA